MHYFYIMLTEMGSYMNKQLICGDIGGTKTLLRTTSFNDGKILEYTERCYDSAAYSSFTDMLKDFLDTAGIHNHPSTACFAVAGPIVAQRVKLTNLPWFIDASDIATKFLISSVILINDFEATAQAIETLPESDRITLQAGKPQAQAMCVVLGAGTGMGVAWLICQGGHYVSLSTEAGHMDFAPTNKLQIGLLEYLQNKFGHVSVERVLSGSGLTHIFNFLQIHPDILFKPPQISLDEDSGAAISELAFKQKHAIAIRSLDLFAEIYGAYAGNLALAGLCRGGVYIAGGIAPKIIDTLKAGNFIHAFRNKGRFTTMMNEIPIQVITNPKVSLLGAEQIALCLLDS
tara:strand:- start:28 stop:1062 length:1035 start_codon:yes stop_codon:yes gene_type:complete